MVWIDGIWWVYLISGGVVMSYYLFFFSENSNFGQNGKGSQTTRSGIGHYCSQKRGRKPKEIYSPYYETGRGGV
jgi:hypothetical protein